MFNKHLKYQIFRIEHLITVPRRITFSYWLTHLNSTKSVFLVVQIKENWSHFFFFALQYLILEQIILTLLSEIYPEFDHFWFIPSLLHYIYHYQLLNSLIMCIWSLCLHSCFSTVSNPCGSQHVSFLICLCFLSLMRKQSMYFFKYVSQIISFICHSYWMLSFSLRIQCRKFPAVYKALHN